MTPFLVIVGIVEAVVFVGLVIYFAVKSQGMDERDAAIERKEGELDGREQRLALRERASGGTAEAPSASGERHEEEEDEEEEEEEDDDEEEGDEEEAKPSLEDRLEALGLQFSDPLTSGEVRCLDDEVRPSCAWDTEDDDDVATCSRCGSAELRHVFAGTSKHVEGHLGNYCFGCGFGKCTHHEAPQDSPMWSNLFLLLKHWAAQSQQSSADPVAVDGALPGAPATPGAPQST